MCYFREKGISNANSHCSRGIDEHLEVMSLLQHADEERFRLSAAGLFQVGMHLLPAVINHFIIKL